jgi:hypothetical protein
MPLILGANKLSDSGYQINNSLRFNPDSTDSLSKTFGVGNRRTFTISFWMKKTKFSVFGYIGVGDGAGNSAGIFNNSDNSIGFYEYVSSSFAAFISTSALLRDPSAWYHIVCIHDSTQATSSNRIKFFINGVQQTVSGTEPALNQNSWFSSGTYPLSIGREDGYANRQYQGYFSDFIYVDGQALDSSYFGETDQDTNIWIPKQYTGTYGTNGFFLKFLNSASLGTDSSGNANNFTVNNLTSIDQTTDTPTNNFCIINEFSCNDAGTLTVADGGLTITGGNDMGATFGLTKGKWYWESKRSNAGTVAHWGIIFDNSFFSSTQLVSGTQSSGYFFRDDFSGGLYVQNSGANGFTNISSSSTGSSVANGDIIGFALDLDSATKSVTFYQNGNQVATATFSYNGTSSTCFPYVRNNTAAQSQWNFGNPPFAIVSGNADGNGYGNFEYAPPSGYYAICSKNLAEYG